jgi:hypothetical protein
LRDELKEVDLWALVRSCEKGGLKYLRQSAGAEHRRLLKLCQEKTENVMALRWFTAEMLAWGIVMGMRMGYPLGKPRPEDTIVGEILKSTEVVKLLRKTPKVSTREICNVLDDKDIRLPWHELRNKNELWATCATKPKVKMAISHARKAAKRMAEDERSLRLINTAY